MADKHGANTREDATGAMTVAAMRTWLREWVASATGLPVAEVTAERPMEEFGLSSRDVVVLSGELENLLGTRLDATVAYEYPTIEKLAVRLVEGDRDNADDGAYDAFQEGAETARTRRVRDDQVMDMDIAVVGMAGRFPGADSADAMWDLFAAGRSGTGEPPEGRWSEYSGDPSLAAQLEGVDLRGGYLEDIAGFDAEFFGLSPLEAQNMDPQQRIILELTWEALEDAHLPASGLRGERVGVFVGSANNDYSMLIAADPTAFHPYALTGGASSIIANRVSYAFDFRGPSVQIDTACSSSLVAIHQAVRALRDGDADLALAGGVNILAAPHASLAFGRLGVFSETGAIHAFSDDASGMIRADGAGLVVLKRLEDAEADGDDVLAVVKGSAVNSDGRSNGLTAPNPDAQVDVLRRAYADAGIDPRDVDYVEAHGTGTILGDPIEASALGTVLGRGRAADRPTLLGSAKTNFGHTEAAAGVAGVIKVVQAMRHDVLPPSLHFHGPNPYIDFDGGRLEVVEDAREWPEYSGRKIAGVSGFGFGGTNAHVVLASPKPSAHVPDDAPATVDLGSDEAAELPSLLPVSGLLPSRRRAAAADLADWLEEAAPAGLSDVARTLAARSRGRSSAVVAADDAPAAVDLLRRVAAGSTAPGIVSADAPAAQGPVWIFSGYGSQHRKMGKDLAALSPVFRATLERLDAVVRHESGWSLLEIIEDDSRTYDLETAQVGITAIQIAQADMMRALGAQPAAVVGMSMGEIAAAYAAGGLPAEEAMRVACARARLMGEGERMIGDSDAAGGMAMVELSVDELDALLEEHPEFAGIEPAVYAAPGMTTVGGPLDAIGRLCEHLTAEGKMARPLQVKGAGHTSALDPILGELAYECSDLAPAPIAVPLFSSVDRGRTYHAGETVHDGDYLVRCTRGSVWFSDAIERAVGAGYTTFVEFAPNPVALMPAMATCFAAGAQDVQLLHVAKRKEPIGRSLGHVLATLHAHGHAVDLAPLAGEGPWAPVPGMRWRRERHWTPARPSSTGRTSLPGSRTVLPDGSIAFATRAEHAPSAHAVIEAAVAAAVPGGVVAAVEEHDVLPPSGDVTTLVTRHPGGAVVAVHAVEGERTRPVATAGVTTSGSGAGLAATPGAGAVAGGPAASAADAPAATGAGAAATPAAGGAGVAGMPGAVERTPAPGGIPGAAPDGGGWSPDGGVPVADHLRTVVGEAMGYDVDDLPLELPLIDLGLDSLMGMRIKNRVEHDFAIPALQVQALRDAAVRDVITLVEGMVVEAHGPGADRGEAAPAAADAGAGDGPDAAGSAGADDAAGSAVPAAGDPAAPAAQSSHSGIDVPPRDDAERLAFGTWAVVTGASAGGVVTQLPEIGDDLASRLAGRLTERVGAEVSAGDVAACTTVEQIADLVRPLMEGEVDGSIRVLRERPEGSTRPAMFLFHAAGGTTAVYRPLVRRLPADVPVYGVERVEGELAERVASYLPDIERLAGDHGIILGGWSFGGILAYETAHQLRARGIEPELIALLDVVQPADPAPDTPEEMHARWDRYAAFANKTYGLELEIPHDLLDQQGEDGMMVMLEQMLSMMDGSTHGLAGGVLEHQRASFVDNRILGSVDFRDWADVDTPVVLFRAERMHDGAIELEPRYAEIREDGGWGAIVDDLEIVHLNGDHLAVVDEPEIATVGAWLTRRLNETS
ncbi:polyketide synthase Pks13 [Corynebacterium sp.]|uniref:polyketide synthase Pks13 n=1 Tax=Corynebacterium sp. TaxID=1720 RepID=UPI0026DA8C3E|nr:polyketide synthase Pks13 [Corynebacterium sp.]MDO4610282.1 polyketide synthase Pks13 [Corynebacterium sp.]